MPTWPRTRLKVRSMNRLSVHWLGSRLMTAPLRGEADLSKRFSNRASWHRRGQSRRTASNWQQRSCQHARRATELWKTIASYLPTQNSEEPNSRTQFKLLPRQAKGFLFAGTTPSYYPDFKIGQGHPAAISKGTALATSSAASISVLCAKWA
jgi:hypothetical protein